MSDAPLSAIVLAAGEGSRMRSERPKPLHQLCGRPMVLHILHALAALNCDRVVIVVGHRGDWVTKAIVEQGPPGLALTFVEQAEQLGTGDAAAVGLTGLPDDERDVLVVPGDAPLLRSASLTSLVETHTRTGAAATVLVTEIDNPTGYGRIVRASDGSVVRVVEEKDATPHERQLREINTSVYCFKRTLLAPALRRLHPSNAQGEYYLTDVVEVLHDAGYHTSAFRVDDAAEVAGVNDRLQLAAAETELRRRINEEWMRQGVTMWDPAHTYVDATVELARDVSLLPGTILRGSTSIGRGSMVGPNAMLTDCTIGERVKIAMVAADQATIGNDATISSFVALERGSEIEAFAMLEAQGPKAK